MLRGIHSGHGIGERISDSPGIVADSETTRTHPLALFARLGLAVCPVDFSAHAGTLQDALGQNATGRAGDERTNMFANGKDGLCATLPGARLVAKSSSCGSNHRSDTPHPLQRAPRGRDPRRRCSPECRPEMPCKISSPETDRRANARIASIVV